MSQKRIIALVDASAYAASVCDYAGWAANRASAHVHALHVLGRREAGTKDYSGSIGLGARTELLEQLADRSALNRHAGLSPRGAVAPSGPRP